ncbi:MAG: RluA family pseudouridine synthase [Gammaproteobacteria bacterium]|nr:RluA family pseudouridine synthase [Gammaproteobacteria bacterium]
MRAKGACRLGELLLEGFDHLAELVCARGVHVVLYLLKRFHGGQQTWNDDGNRVDESVVIGGHDVRRARFAYRGMCRTTIRKFMAEFTAHIPPPCDEAVNILHADDDLLVVVKPAGLLSVPGRFVKDCVLHRVIFDYADASIVHRLDLDTSGVMVLTRSKRAARSLSEQFRERRVDKEYVAIAWGHIEESRGTLDFPLGPDPINRPRHLVTSEGREAITDYEVGAFIGAHTRVRLRPKTGRSHQLRIHLAHIGHPILGCDLYAHPDAFAAAGRLMLHAERLSFEHPASRERVTFAADAPFLGVETACDDKVSGYFLVAKAIVFPAGSVINAIHSSSPASPNVPSISGKTRCGCDRSSAP